MSKITHVNLDGGQYAMSDPRFENDKFLQYDLGAIAETSDTSQNETLQKIYDAAASGGSVAAVYNGIILEVSEVSTDKMILSSKINLTFTEIEAKITSGTVESAVSRKVTPITYGEDEPEIGVTPLPAGTIYCRWGSSSTDVDPEGLTFTSDNPFTLKFAGNNGYSTPANIEMTTNGNDWTSFNSASVITFDSAMNTATGKHTIAVKADNYINDVNEYVGYGDEPSRYYSFSFTNGSNISVSKTLKYITGDKWFGAGMNTFAFLFKDCTQLIDATNLVFPDVKNPNLYDLYGMFKGCTNLLDICEITLSGEINPYSCAYMFQNCNNLKSDLNLKIKFDSSQSNNAIGHDGFAYMFANTKITTPIDLTAVSLAQARSFKGMYQDCTELTYPSNMQPVLNKLINSALSSASEIFVDMYNGCSKLHIYNTPQDFALNFVGYIEGYGMIEWEDPDRCAGGMFEGCVNAPALEGIPGLPEETTYYFKKS